MVWDAKEPVSVPNHPVVSQLGTLSGMDGTLRRLRRTLSDGGDGVLFPVLSLQARERAIASNEPVREARALSAG